MGKRKKDKDSRKKMKDSRLKTLFIREAVGKRF